VGHGVKLTWINRRGRQTVREQTAARALATGWRGRPRRWFAAAALIGLAALWVIVVTLTFGSTTAARQRTFVASRAGAQMLTSLLEQDLDVRTYQATGDARLLRGMAASAAELRRAGAQARAAVASDPSIASNLDAQLTLAGRWERLASAGLGHPRPRAGAPAFPGAFTQALDSFRSSNEQFQASVAARRAELQTETQDEGLAMAAVLSAIILLGALGAIRGFGRADARLRTLVNRSLDLITIVDAEGRVVYQSPAIARVLGYETTVKPGTAVTDLLDPADAPRMALALRRAREEPSAGRAAECRWRHADGSYRWLETVCNNLLSDPHVGGVVLNSRDVTERRQLSEQLRQRAFHDPLTGLANRARLEERLSRMLERENGTVALLFVDLDNFKMVNDSLGHAAGDRFLTEIARRLSSCVRLGDTVARMGGDEFALLLAGIDASLRAPRIAERILDALKPPIELDQRAIIPGASIGITIGRAGQDVQEVLRDADLALYDAKHQGKGQAQLYRPAMHSAALQRLELEGDLRAALQREELTLYYQPLYRLTDGGLAGYEALIRWQHPERGLLLPDRFIDLAEQTGLIVPLTRWALRTACDQAAAWQRQAGRPLEVGVNLSFINLQDEAIVADVEAALESSSLSPVELVLEITESTVMRDHERSCRILRRLKELGVRLALDDFGTGYSSLSRLSALPFDALKIPRPFIERIATNDSEFALTQGIVDLGHRLNLNIVAEGIETQPQLARVRAIGCELGQGFHLASPASSSSIDAQPSTAAPAAIELPPVARKGSLRLVEGAGGG